MIHREPIDMIDPETRGLAGRDRHPQGQAVRARRTDAAGSSSSSRGRETRRHGRLYFRWRGRRTEDLQRPAVAHLLHRRRLPMAPRRRDAAAVISTRAPSSSTSRPSTRRRWRRSSSVWARSTPGPTPTVERQLPRRLEVVPTATSGERPGQGLLVDLRLRHPDPVRAADLTALPQPQQRHAANSSSTSDGSVDILFGPEQPAAAPEQLDPDRPREGLVHELSGCTARSNPGTTTPGSPATSNRSPTECPAGPQQRHWSHHELGRATPRSGPPAHRVACAPTGLVITGVMAGLDRSQTGPIGPGAPVAPHRRIWRIAWRVPVGIAEADPVQGDVLVPRRRTVLPRHRDRGFAVRHGRAGRDLLPRPCPGAAVVSDEPAALTPGRLQMHGRCRPGSGWRSTGPHHHASRSEGTNSRRSHQRSPAFRDAR